jgi:hypothetical protein
LDLIGKLPLPKIGLLFNYLNSLRPARSCAYGVPTGHFRVAIQKMSLTGQQQQWSPALPILDNKLERLFSTWCDISNPA